MLTEGIRPGPVLIVLTDGYADWETAMISASARRFYGGEVRHATPGGGKVTSMGGLRSQELPDLDPRGDEVIVLCGGGAWTEADAPDLAPLLRGAWESGQTIAAICGATVALARAGLLGSLRHTSNSLDFLREHAPGYQGDAFYADRPYAVADRRIITAPGSAPVTFAALVLTAAGVPEPRIQGLRQMMAAEH